MNEGCYWLIRYNTGHRVYCHYYKINDMVLYTAIAILLMFYTCRNVGSVDLRYRKPACGPGTGLALGCRVHMSISFNNFIINMRHSFGLFRHYFCVGACMFVYLINCMSCQLFNMQYLIKADVFLLIISS